MRCEKHLLPKAKHSAFRGLCRRSYVFGQSRIEDDDYDEIHDLGWFENYQTQGGSPCTKVCNCLRQVLGIEPDESLLRYQIDISRNALDRATRYLESIAVAT